METNRSITRLFHCAHHPDVCWWYLSEFESHDMGTGAADVAWHWCCIKGCEWQNGGRGNYAWVLRPPAHLPALLPPSTLPESPPGHSHHVSSLTSIAVGTALPVAKAEEYLMGPSFSAGVSSFSCHSLAWSCAYFSDRLQVSRERVCSYPEDQDWGLRFMS